MSKRLVLALFLVAFAATLNADPSFLSSAPEAGRQELGPNPCANILGNC